MFPSTPGVNPIQSSHLDIQRRMHPEIAHILRATLYPFLEDHETVLNSDPVPGMKDRIWWLNHQEPEDTADPQSPMATSFSNAFEVEMVAGLVEYLVNSNEYDFKDITILTPYNRQLAALTERFNGICSLWLSERDREKLIDEGLLDPLVSSLKTKTDIPIANMLKVATIDNFQGEESRVVILSTVRSNPEGRVGFLRTSNRINVACSRARNGFYVIGDASIMGKVDMWQKIRDHLAAREKIGREFRTCCPRHPNRTFLIHSPEQWRSISECPYSCNAELACGHNCRMKCHPLSLHERIGCDQPCLRIHTACGHPCKKTCGEPCGECEFPLQTITLTCGHETVQTCTTNRNANAMMCNALLERVQLRCGHWVARHCSTANEPMICQEQCDHLLHCGHRCLGSCHECTNNGQHLSCASVCSRVLKCGHHCAQRCHEGQCSPCQLPCRMTCGHSGCTQECGKPCDPCLRPCDWTCPHLGSCGTMCFLPCDRIPCNEPCTKLFTCGHLCSSLCGEACPLECPECITGQPPTKTQMFLPCGHTVDLETMDNHVGIANFYELDDTGQIRKANLTSVQALLSVKAACPTCGADCKRIRRYALAAKLLALEGYINPLLSKFSLKLNSFMEQMYSVKLELDRTFSAFSMTLKPSPLSGRTNEELVHGRTTVLAGLQKSIAGFRSKLDLKLSKFPC